MKPFNLYKHTNNTDVALCPVKIFFVPEKGTYKIKCKWFNIVNPNNAQDIGVEDRIEIKAEDMPNWKLYENE